jgi:beta-N-acetylhexosaminidase
VKLVMAGHIALPAVSAPRGDLSGMQQQTSNPELPATFSSPILRGLLRQELGFEGVTTSDALDMGPIEQGSWFVIDAIAAAAAGLDLLLFGPTTAGWEAVVAGLAQAARRGLLSAADLEVSAHRVQALKHWLAGYEQPPLEVVGCAEHQALALEIARQAVTLIRDAGGLLPLHLEPEERLLVVLPKPTDLTPADTSSYLNLSLAEYMRPYHAATDELLIPMDPSETDIVAVHGQANGYAQVVVGTINALDHPGQVALVHKLQESGIPIAVAALRAPFDLLCFPDVPAYICTYSIQPPALQALTEAMLGRIPFRGVLPVAIPGVL